MKRNLFFACLLVWFSSSSVAQFRGSEPKPPSMSDQRQPSSPSFFGFLSSDDFQMRHSVSMSYLSMGNQSLGVTMYTNSMRYRLADNLFARADVSLAFSPFGSMGAQSKNDFSSIFLNRVSIDYKPFKDVQINLQYRGYPNGYLNSNQGGVGTAFRPFAFSWQDDW
jgi:hypothetical protein